MDTRFPYTALSRCRALVSVTTAARGGTIEVPGIDRKPCAIQIRPGVQHGNQIRLRGRGMPALNGRGIGDLVVQIEVEMPTKLSRSEEHTSELQSLMRISYAVFCLKKHRTKAHTQNST